jgi:plastocyanin
MGTSMARAALFGWRISGWLLALLPGVLWAAQVDVQVVEPNGQALAGAVVFLDSPEAARRTRPLASAEIVQQNKQFLPDVLVVPRGTAVQFPNRDTVRHHVYSFSPAKKFELKLYVGTPANPVVFDQAGVVVLGCNIHDHMVGWVLVVDTPHHGVTGADGRIRLDAVPSGDYTLRVWHQRLNVGAEAQSQQLKVADGLAPLRVVLNGLRP